MIARSMPPSSDNPGRSVKRLRKVRELSRQTPFPEASFTHWFATRPDEIVVKILICLIHQTKYLLDQQIPQLEAGFLKKDGLRGRMFAARKRARGS